MNLSDIDKHIMFQLIQLAATKRGTTGANPTVAAAIVKDEKSVASGVHEGEGLPHAEVNAIQTAGELCKGATLYVTLEPCTHHGKTPPCVEAIIESGISKVIYAVDDPNPKVRETSATSVLEAAGIEVVSGLLAEEARKVNDVFFHVQEKKSPFVTMKVAQSLDGKVALANGESQYITSEASRQVVHQLRREANAILVGIGTILADDPALNVRYDLLQEGYRNPVKIILDPDGRTPLDARVFSENEDTEVWIVVDEAKLDSMTELSKKAKLFGAKVTDKGFDLSVVFQQFFNAGIYHMFVEGGPKVYSYMLEAGLVNKLVTFIAPSIIGQQGAKAPFELEGISSLDEQKRLTDIQVQQFGDDVCIWGYLTSSLDQTL